jgi:hypothetical protein
MGGLWAAWRRSIVAVSLREGTLMSKLCRIALVLALVVGLWPHPAAAMTFSGYPAGKAPFDLEWHSTQDVDANGFPVNPIWSAQESNANGNPSPNFANDCGPGGYYPPNSACTNQPTEWDPQDATFAAFGECGGDPFPGHLNWDTVTDIGYIEWESASGSWPNDNDINMRLDPYLPVTEALDSGQSSLGLEFDSTETINNFGDPFWQPGQIGSSTNGDIAVVSGVLGVDGVHHGGWTEIHPVLAMAILTSEVMASKTKTTETAQWTWQYFIRNFGNEGGCGSQEFAWNGRNGSWYLTLPVSGVGDLFFPGNVMSAAAHATYWTNGNDVGPPNIRGGISQLTFGPNCPKSECGTGPNSKLPIAQVQVITVGVGLPQSQTAEDGVLTVLATYSLPKQSQSKKAQPKAAPHVASNVTAQDWEEPNEPDVIIARITDPSVRSSVEALVKANAPVLHPHPDVRRGSVTLATLSAPTALSSTDVQQLSAVHAAAEDPAHKAAVTNLQTKLKAVMPSPSPKS